MRSSKALSYFIFLILSVGGIINTAFADEPESSTDDSELLTDDTNNLSLSLDDIKKELEQGDDFEADLRSDLRKYANDMQSSIAQITEETSKGKDSDKKRLEQLTKEYKEAEKKAQKIIETIRKRRKERSFPTELPHPQDKPNIENNVGYMTNCPGHKKRRKIAEAEAEEQVDSQEKQ